MGKSQKTYMSIKSKLIAAVAMLLVASFMVVSSTYAWFTLSTAPEVKGIKTTIGSNGSLEIALAYGNSATPFDASKVDSKVGDSNNYETWGNIVDVAAAKYGLATLKAGILPSRLNITDAANGIVGLNPLSTPAYGADGRITELKNETIYGIFDSTSASFKTDADGSGVRVIGTASGMTQQQIDYRNAKHAISTDLATAKTLAAKSLNDNGPKLASVFATYATNSSDSTTYDVTAIGSVLTTLTSAADAIESAIKNYYVAAAASKSVSLGEVEYAAAIAAVRAKTVAELVAGPTIEGVTLPAASGAVADAYAKLTAIRTSLGTAQTKYDEIGANKTAATGAQMIAALSPIMNIENVTINGLTKTEVQDTDGLSQLLNKYMDMGGIFVELPMGSGVYADIAEVTGNYTASIKIESITLGGSLGTLSNVPATMRTTVPTASVINLTAGFDTAFPTPESAGNTNPNITDFYGYAIDLVFRTNAQGSNLMLQTTPAQRIYSDSTLADTLGGGSTMNFTFPNALDETQQKNLLNAIRIVFTQQEVVGSGDSTTTQSKIVAIAGLDTESIQITGEGSTASIKLLNYTLDTKTETDAAGVSKQSTVINIDTVDRFKGNDSTKQNNWAQTLMPLNANTPTVLTAMVYIDGDYITNADVANAAVSLTGTLNLQFSSDAELVPMEYTPLHQKDEGGSSTPSQGN